MRFSYDERSDLPRVPAIYQLQKRSLLGWDDIYIGQSTNVYERWNREGERRHQHLYKWKRDQRLMRLHVSPCWRCNLDYRERLAIQRLNPRLNEQRFKPRWSIMVLAEDLWRLRFVAIAGLVLLRLATI